MNLVLFHGRGSPAVRQATGSGLSGHFFADPVAVPPEAGVRGDPLHGLDRGPVHQPAALLGDPATTAGGVGLVMPGRQPGPAGQLLRPGKRVTSPISATNTAARSLPPREWPGSRRTRGLPVPRMLLRIVRLAVVITQSWWEVRAEWGRCPSAAVGG